MGNPCINLPFVCPVAGVSFRPQTVARCQQGDLVVIRRDPTNPYDGQACAVYHDSGEQLGFLPKALAGRMDGDGPWQGTICEVLRGRETTGLRIRVEGVLVGCAVERDPGCAEPAVDVEQKLVVARSGRVLGVLVGELHGRVQVRTGDGQTLSYPRELVEITHGDTATW
jgi:hypothetical protein